MNTPLRIKVYPAAGLWVAVGINCPVYLSRRDKDELYKAVVLAATDVREDPRIHARAVAA